jgi:hypothetical protein
MRLLWGKSQLGVPGDELLLDERRNEECSEVDSGLLDVVCFGQGQLFRGNRKGRLVLIAIELRGIDGGYWPLLVLQQWVFAYLRR